MTRGSGSREHRRLLLPFGQGMDRGTKWTAGASEGQFPKSIFSHIFVCLLLRGSSGP